MATARSAALPPGPSAPGLWITLRYMADPYRIYRECAQRFGSPFTLNTLRGPLVVVTDPDQAKQVFTADPESLEVWGAEALQPVVGPTSLLLVSGARHRRDRKLLTPPFHGDRMRAYGAVMLDAARHEAARWNVGDELRFLPAAQNISLEVILRAVFGVRERETVARWTDAITHMMETAHPAGLFFEAARVAPFGLGPWAKFLRARAEVDRRIYQQIHERRTQGDYGDDVLSLMMQARYDDGAVMTDAELRDELLTLLLAGHETTAISLSWALRWLHAHPQKLARVRDELDALPPEPAPEAIAALPYLDAVCAETLRMNPIVSDVVRTVRSPLEVGGHTLPANTAVAVSIATIHERVPRPFEFEPERFLQKKFSPFEYMPFGGGHRRCIGAAFALYEMKIVLAELLRAHQFALVGDELVARRGITLGPKNGVRVTYLGPRSQPRPAHMDSDRVTDDRARR
jgi:cytochrome P450